MTAAQKRHGQGQDDADNGSFPASDPPSSSGITGPRRDRREPSEQPSEQVATPHGPVSRHEARPHGMPTPDRHRSETAHHPEHEATKTKGR